MLTPLEIKGGAASAAAARASAESSPLDLAVTANIVPLFAFLRRACAFAFLYALRAVASTLAITSSIIAWTLASRCRPARVASMRARHARRTTVWRHCFWSLATSACRRARSWATRARANMRRWNVSIDRNESLGSVMQMHDELADAIIAGNAKQARAVMTRHVAGFQASLTA